MAVKKLVQPDDSPSAPDEAVSPQPSHDVVSRKEPESMRISSHKSGGTTKPSGGSCGNGPSG